MKEIETFEVQAEQFYNWSYNKEQKKIVLKPENISSLEELSEKSIIDLKKLFKNEFPNELFPDNFDIIKDE